MAGREEMTMDKIKKLSDKNPNLNPYKQEEEMYSEIADIIEKYSGIISTVAAVGVLELVKNRIFEAMDVEVKS